MHARTFQTSADTATGLTASSCQTWTYDERARPWCVSFTHIVPTPKFHCAECQYSVRHYIFGNMPTNFNRQG